MIIATHRRTNRRQCAVCHNAPRVAGERLCVRCLPAEVTVTRIPVVGQ